MPNKTKETKKGSLTKLAYDIPVAVNNIDSDQAGKAMLQAIWEDVASVGEVLGVPWQQAGDLGVAFVPNDTDLIQKLKAEHYDPDTVDYVPPEYAKEGSTVEKKASYELSFTPEFYGDPNTWTSPRQDRASNVADAIRLMAEKDPEEFANMLKDVLGYDDAAVEVATANGINDMTVMDVMDKIDETNTCGDLVTPVDVWIDPEGHYTLDIYDDREGDEKDAAVTPSLMGRKKAQSDDDDIKFLDKPWAGEFPVDRDDSLSSVDDDIFIVFDDLEAIINKAVPNQPITLTPQMVELLSQYHEGQSDPLYAVVSRAGGKGTVTPSEEELNRIKETIPEIVKTLNEIYIGMDGPEWDALDASLQKQHNKHAGAAFPDLFSKSALDYIELQTAIDAANMGNPASVEQANQYIDAAAKQLAQKMAEALPQEVRKVVDAQREAILKKVLPGGEESLRGPQPTPMPSAQPQPQPQPMPAAMPMPASLKKAFAAAK